jgi:hypothetical protein
MRTVTWVLFWLLPICAFAQYKAGAPCHSFLMMVEQDEATSDLAMTGLTRPQLDWARKNQHKELEGICPLPYDPTNKRIPASTITDENLQVDPGARPVYLVRWKQERVFVPDLNHGHIAIHSSGVLYRMGKSLEGDLIPIGPVHDTSRTILSDSTVSLLKDVLEQIKLQTVN